WAVAAWAPVAVLRDAGGGLQAAAVWRAGGAGGDVLHLDMLARAGGATAGAAMSLLSGSLEQLGAAGYRTAVLGLVAYVPGEDEESWIGAALARVQGQTALPVAALVAACGAQWHERYLLYT